MEENKAKQYFDILLKNYEEGKFGVSWRQNALLVMNDIDYDDSIPKEEFKKFVSNFTDALRKKAINDEDDEEYSDYVNIFFDRDKDAKYDIITRCTSKLNICNFFGLEILTKRNKDLDPTCYSALLNLNLQKPCDEGDAIIEPTCFEMSIKDIKTLTKSLEKAIKDIEKLRNK